VKGSKVEMLPGLQATPRVMLEKAVERLPTLRHVVVIEEDLEGYVRVYTSQQMTYADMAWIRHQFNKITD